MDESKAATLALAALLILALSAVLMVGIASATDYNLCHEVDAPERILGWCASEDAWESAYGWRQGWYCHPANQSLDGCDLHEPIPAPAPAPQAEREDIFERYAGCAWIRDQQSGDAIVNCNIVDGKVDLSPDAPGAIFIKGD